MLTERVKSALAAALAVVCWGGVFDAGAQDAKPERRYWSGETLDALVAYRRGDYAHAVELARRALDAAKSERVRIDARTVEALCLLQGPERQSRLEGRARLAQLVHDDPTLADEPECDFAYGESLIATHETAAALDYLDRAADRFAAHEQPERLAEVLIALGRAWIAHAEWERMSAERAAQRPADAHEAHAIRMQALAALRDRIAPLDAPGTLARFDLEVARYLLHSGRDVPRGCDMLERLSGAEAFDETASAATLELAQYYEDEHRWSDAVRHYGRAARWARGNDRVLAQSRLNELTRPGIELDMPAQVRVGEVAVLGVRARGVGAVTLEVRRVDVGAWLTDMQTRRSEALLPDTGSLLACFELDTRVDDSIGWWTSESLADPPTFEGPAGGYLVLARGTDPAGRPVRAKRLLLASDLVAAACIGREHVALWANAALTRAGDPQPGSTPSAIEAAFWMDRSFMPTRATFEDGVARFRLPNESRVLRDRGWVCLVQHGEHMAVLRGELATPPASRAGAYVLAGPPAAAPGDTLHFCGILDAPFGATADRPRVQLMDGLGTVLREQPVPVSQTGAWNAAFDVAGDWAGKHVHALLRGNGQLIENRLPARSIRIVAEEPPGAPRVELQLRTPSGSRALAADFVAATAAGEPLRGLEAVVVVEAIRLPAFGTVGQPNAGSYIVDIVLDAAGRGIHTIEESWLPPGDGPLAVRVRAQAVQPDARAAADTREVLLGAAADGWAWLSCDPPSPRAGEPVRLRVGSYRPGGLVVPRHPVVEVSRDGHVVAKLNLAPGTTMASLPWVPTEPGDYTVSTAFDTQHGATLRARGALRVGEPEVASADQVRGTARWQMEGGTPTVEVELTGIEEASALVVLENGDVLAARSCSTAESCLRERFELRERDFRDTCARVFGWRDGRIALLASVPVVPAPAARPRIKLQLDDRAATPGVASVRVVTDAGPDHPLTLVARLYDATTGRFDGWRRAPDDGRNLAAVEPITVLSAGGPIHVPEAAAQDRDAARERRAAALASEEDALWCAAATLEQPIEVLRVPIPGADASCRLLVVVFDTRGAQAAEDLLIGGRTDGAGEGG